MIKGIVRALIHAAAVVGFTGTVMLLAGRGDARSAVNVLSLIGFLFISVGVVAVLSGSRNRGSTVYAESVSRRSLSERAQDSLVESTGRYASLIRWSLVGVFVEIVSVLLYFFAPSPPT